MMEVIMRSSFSEISFAHIITKEIEDKVIFSSFNLGMPYFPTQNAENDLGYDVCLKGELVALFIQYKTSEKYVRKSAKYWMEFGSEYFKFDIYADNMSPQHNLLVQLAKKEKNNVFYCAPAFIEYEKMVEFYNNKQVSKNSIFVNCRSLKEIQGDEKHDICFTINPVRCIMHSSDFFVVDDVFIDMDKLVEQATHFKNIYDFFYECRSVFNNDIIVSDNISNSFSNIADYLESRGIHFIIIKK